MVLHSLEVLACCFRRADVDPKLLEATARTAQTFQVAAHCPNRA